ncbi:GRIP and coiled-coil domain-containing protein-like [Montipora capricornis]|uniref:GRIP and coiled-coil domain-containing protein-like n=1 Tax=Montipora capricornis TaxID=246305 RepID=UPI0035F1028D
MAEGLSNFFRKSRIRSSSSSGEEISTSPELKKLREAGTSFDDNDAHVEKTNDDVLMEALEKIGDFSEKLNSILTWLDKLDIIENSVRNIESNVANLKARTAKLEEFEIVAKKDIKVVKEKCSLNGEKIKGLQTQLDSLNKQTEKEDNLQEQIDELLSKNLYLESYSRRENVKFFSIPEEQDENTEDILREFMERELGYHDARSVEIQQVHRINRGRNALGPRPIIARFLRYKNVEEIFALGRRLEGSGYQMFHDLPQEIVKRRREQMLTRKKARRNGLKASFSRSQPDKLFINGKFWPRGKFLEVAEEVEETDE